MLLRVRTKILATDGFDVASLLAIYRCSSRFDVVRGTGFDLAEAEHIFVPADEIDFAVMPRRAVVSRNHDVSTPAQIEISIFLSATTGAEVGWSSLSVCRFRGYPI